MNNVMPLRDRKGILWERGKCHRPSEGELADRLAERHCREVRYAAWRKKWIAWHGTEWLFDTQNLALHLAREICQRRVEGRKFQL